MSSKKRWTLEIDQAVLKTLKKMPRRDAERVLILLREKRTDPYVGDIKKLRGEDEVWRHRVGAHRVFFEVLIKERVVHVFLIERRTSKTYRRR